MRLETILKKLQSKERTELEDAILAHLKQYEEFKNHHCAVERENVKLREGEQKWLKYARNAEKSD